LTLYDALGLFRNVQRHRWVEPSEVRQREPLISQQGLLGAARFYDAQADDARLTLTTAKSAHLHGAVTANHVRVVDLMRANGRSTGACLVDQINGGEIETRAKVIVNATGVWGDQVRLMERDCKDRLIRPSKGIHLVVKRERLCSDHAVVFDSPRDGRHVFIIPWDDLALIGTTDTDYDGDTDKPAATADDVAYVLEAARHAFSAAQIDQDTIISTIAGLRPLITASGGSYDVSREHEIIESPGGLITVAGGKLTTHRLMGEQVVDRVQEKLAKTFGLKADCECRTRERLEGAQTEGTLAGSERRTAVARHLVDAYGADAAGIMAYAKENPGLAERIAPGRPYLMAEVPYAVHNEMALTLSDVLVRRMHLIYETRGGGLSRARAVAEVMAPLLGWDQSEIDRQVSDYTSEVALTQRWREE
jgi:glycerol-3-phosphate dehydrogenase